jgi:hypothetical protein
MADALHLADEGLPVPGQLFEHLGREVEDGGAVALVERVPLLLVNLRVLEDAAEVNAVELRGQVVEVEQRGPRVVRVDEVVFVDGVRLPGGDV